ncbi:MAG: hypothetical protein IPJ21_11990 [Sterolibacteriaceae bacterium]|nr:hypothetical protein [Sterolibacteriaceae bacterium]
MAVSLALAALPAYVLFIVLRVAGPAIGIDLIGVAIDTLINTHLPLLTTLSDWIKQHPTWSPFLAIWAALATTVFKVWSKRIEFFAVSAQDSRAMRPRPKSKAHEGIVPWVEAPERSTSSDGATPESSLHKTWAAQRKAGEALLAWIRDGAGDGRWGGFWPRQPTSRNADNWQPLKLALLTGANGVGKSALVDALCRRLASVRLANSTNIDAERGIRSRLRERRATAGAWMRTVLPWLRRNESDPWDVGVLTPGDELQIAALRTWEPRRPTVFVIDEPDAGASQALKVLEGRRDAFWHPVRVLLIDQAFPPALDDYLPSPAAEKPPALPLEHSNDLDLGNLRLDEGAVRGMWRALCDEQRQLWAARTTDSPNGAPDFGRISKKLWHSDEVKKVLRLSDGNPLPVALVLAELAGTTQTVFEVGLGAGAGPVSRAMETEAALQSFECLDCSQLRHRMIAKRAADLVSTYEGILQRQALNVQHEVMLAIAAATVTGGLALPPELSARLPASALDNLFPTSDRSDSLKRVWIPPVRPMVIGRAFLDAWVGSRAAPEALAREVAAFAWQHNPEGALRGLHQGQHLPDVIRQALARLAGEQAQSLPWAQGCCAALLCNDANAAPFVAALGPLSLEQLQTLDRWLKDRLAPLYPRRPDPLSALVAIAHVAARRAAKTAGGLSQIDIAAEVRLFAHWSALAGDTATHRLPRRHALAGALTALLKSLTEGGNIGETTRVELADEPLIAYREMGREVNLAACRCLTRYARNVALALPDLTESAVDPNRYERLARAWRLASRAASQLGGERALTLTQSLAERVEAIATAHADFAAHAGLQQERAKAWRYAAYAASQLGGERALTLTQSPAERVEAIATAHADFAAHAGLQQERAIAWRYAVDVASELGRERALTLSQALAKRVDAAASAHADFVTHAGLQQERAIAWRHAAFAACRLGGERALTLTRALAERVEAIATARADFVAHAGLQEARAATWRHAAYAANQLGGERALTLTEALAERVEAIAAVQPDFAVHVGIQVQRATAWRFAVYVASHLGGERALELSQGLAERVDAIVTAHPDFIAHSRLHNERAIAWRYATYAASTLSGERALTLSQVLAERVDAIANARSDFASHGGLQRERAFAWQHAAYVASKLGGARALMLSQALAERVEAIATAHADFAADAELRQVRATAWRSAASAACQLGGDRALTLSQALAERVEAIATAHADFAADARLQHARAGAWRSAAYAAGQLGGDRALTLSQALAERVEAIATAHADFAADAMVQQVRAGAWRSAAYAAGQLGGDRALTLSQALAERVEAIATAHADFAAHAGLQDERATAWRHAADAGCRLGGERGRNRTMAAARRIRDIVFSRQWDDPRPFQHEWNEVQRYLAELGVNVTDRAGIELTGTIPTQASPTSRFATGWDQKMIVPSRFDKPDPGAD